MQYPATLISLSAAGFALIYLVVLASQLGGASLALAVLVIAALALDRNVRRGSTRSVTAKPKRRREIANIELAEAEAARTREAQVSELRRTLAQGFARIGIDDGSRSVEGLTAEFDAVLDSLRHDLEGSPVSFTHILPGLAEETYRRGLSALSDALALLEVAEGPERLRLGQELEDITERLEHQSSKSGCPRSDRDEQRKASHQLRLAALDELRQRADELLFEGERCEATLHQARIELASVRAGNADRTVDSVIETLQENIRRVREVQEELRKLHY